MKKLIDLSHVIEDGMITYKGLPAPIMCDFLSREEAKGLYAEGTSFQIGKVEMVGNTGTYLDCAFHRYEDGQDLASVMLEACVGLPILVVRVPYTERLDITAELFANLDIAGKAVLIDTGWDEHWRTDQYFENHPYLTEDAAIFLRDAGAKLVGIDSHNIDHTIGNARPVHTVLLKENILIVEHLCNLASVPEDKECTFTAAPPKFKGVGTFSVRAFVTVTE